MIVNLAIFGGSFDPPHKGHVGIIEKVLATLKLDLLIVLVAYQNPLKAHYRVHAQKRLAWMKDICKSYNNVLCSDYEILQNKPTTTKESMEYFKDLYKPSTMYFILGQDNFLQVPQWSCFEILRENLCFIVFERIANNSFNTTYKSQFACEQFAQQHKLKMKYLNFSYPYASSLIVQNLEYYQDEIPENIRYDVIESYKTLHVN